MLSTATKMRIARTLSTTLLDIGFRAQQRVRRGGVAYEVDLREGIDLSLYLFGGFQSHVLRMVRRFVPANGIMFDIGANIGAIALPVAAHLTGGHVYAFEPTDFAYSKLARNLELNPNLAERITPIKCFVGDRSTSDSKMIAYSSWPLIQLRDADVHPIHKGISKPGSSEQTTIDSFADRHCLARLSLLKIDTDGHEFAVLSGANNSLQRFRPIVLFEACEYLMRPPHPTFEDFEELLVRAGYTIRYGGRPRRITASDFHALCPRGGSLDLLGVPNEHHTGRPI